MKKIIITLCVICVLLLCSISVGATTNIPYGDVNDDGTIDTKDVRLCLKSLVFSEMVVNILDLNGDTVVNTLDVRQLLTEIITTEETNAKLLAFQTPVNSSLTYEEIEANRVAQVINTYEEFETICAKIHPCFYTPYENKNGSFDSWAETITSEYFETKSLFIFTYGTSATNFKLDYVLSEDILDIQIELSDRNWADRIECWQLIVELDKKDIIDRQLEINFK